MSVSRIAEADPLVVVGSETQKTKVDNVPVLSIDELLKKKQKKKSED